MQKYLKCPALPTCRNGMHNLPRTPHGQKVCGGLHEAAPGHGQEIQPVKVVHPHFLQSQQVCPDGI